MKELIINKPSELLLTKSDTWESMMEKGIIEPFNTCKTTLENAVSIAGQILSCNCAIINNNF
jgi:chaperonin GroEL (HSP60 family)